MWHQGSHHKRWLLEPSSRECQWRCSFDRWSCPAEPKLRSQLKHNSVRQSHIWQQSQPLASLTGVLMVIWLIYICMTVTVVKFSLEGTPVSEKPQCMVRCVIPSLTSAFSVSKTFCPLMSLWITWWEWRWERPWKTNIHTEITITINMKAQTLPSKSGCIMWLF